jgi:hypothetical protein
VKRLPWVAVPQRILRRSALYFLSVGAEDKNDAQSDPTYPIARNKKLHGRLLNVHNNVFHELICARVNEDDATAK